MNLRQLDSIYPCTCGHMENRHGYCAGVYVCWECYDVIEAEHRMPDTYPGHEFKADNLKYLEALLHE